MSSPIPSFHCFTELPVEIRIQIWHLAADQAGSTGPQVLPLLLVHELSWEPPRSYIHIPHRWRTLYLQPRLRARLALLHSCREARAELLQPPSSASPPSSPVSSVSSANAPLLSSIPARPTYQLTRAPSSGSVRFRAP
ncbi:hypothetical protein PG996_011049 [Apiospora saccharicola]|uniref:2EXR domain-containing protein n=1 Tax=Apiospora saccharicola TaxID=335842 RepID=A0ABR1UEH8_9PEZI